MPPQIAAQFTTGEAAVLSVVAVEVAKRGNCTLTIGHLAAVAGVSESTVRRAIRQAKVLSLVEVRERRVSRFRNESNVVTVTSRSWLAWLKLGRQTACQNRQGTNTRVLGEGRQRAGESILGAIREVSRTRRGRSAAERVRDSG